MTNVKLTQGDYEARVARRDAGQHDDEDLRLIEHYEAQGFTVGRESDLEPESEVTPEEAPEVKPARSRSGRAGR